MYALLRRGLYIQKAHNMKWGTSLTTRAGNESSRTCLNSARLDKNWFGSKLDSSSKRIFFWARVRLQLSQLFLSLGHILVSTVLSQKLHEAFKDKTSQ
ncbi:hypothetical protein MTR_8g104390 [Medicago truncatula]|uniref:Uncharacterized protein n=1 Tax=Medicago truncatula TaxID=3880 RepID=G7L9R4_MEDTR|nr:hypothetical protein MTR_8g104390 [Medicago truncatula]